MDQPIIPKDKVGAVGTTDTLADPKYYNQTLSLCTFVDSDTSTFHAIKSHWTRILLWEDILNVCLCINGHQ